MQARAEPRSAIGAEPHVVDAFVLKLDPSGGYLWSRAFGGPQTTTWAKAAASGMESVVLAGYFDGQINLGGATLTTTGDNDVFVAKLLTP